MCFLRYLHGIDTVDENTCQTCLWQTYLLHNHQLRTLVILSGRVLAQGHMPLDFAVGPKLYVKYQEILFLTTNFSSKDLFGPLA